ncbi:hypothetical protein CFK37_01610 [Virgibacillus phasianinus]|uniref:DUF4064 domain-containing protein n=1 Tax=Virgibacillus phasianinus TaxID=2017483 RepID=A0A220TZ03_9BACI|nr:DUF4064 domain-containing protein [Virgibacillus phasianinus]ASK60999.1 hypothetical protein CFK37_01610 [Virgibacillus phasianinus]
MKRTGEVTLGIIGAFFYAFFAIIGAVMVWVENNREQVESFFREAAAQDPSASISMTDLNDALDAVGNSGLILTIISVVAIILGIISMIFLKGNKKPKAAGIILIVTAVVVAFISYGAGIIAGIFYLIAGIMALARKPKTIIYE